MLRQFIYKKIQGHSPIITSKLFKVTEPSTGSIRNQFLASKGSDETIEYVTVPDGPSSLSDAVTWKIDMQS